MLTHCRILAVVRIWVTYCKVCKKSLMSINIRLKWGQLGKERLLSELLKAESWSPTTLNNTTLNAIIVGCL